jgi:hypothetical protein
MIKSNFGVPQQTDFLLIQHLFLPLHQNLRKGDKNKLKPVQ